MYLSIFLGFLAGFLQIVAFVIYNKQLIRGLSKPNITSWGLWAFLSSLNTITYIKFTEDMVKGIMPLTISVIVIFTFLYVLKKGKPSKLDSWDILILFFGVISFLVWQFYQSEVFANLILQLGIAISYIPTYRGVWRNTYNEKPSPWLIWGVAYAIGAIVVLLRWTGQYEALVYPFANSLLSVGVGLLVLRGVKKFSGTRQANV